MGKLYGQAPHKYFEIIDNPGLNAGIDLACMMGYLEDENFHFKESQKTAQNEAGAVNGVLEELRKQQDDR